MDYHRFFFPEFRFKGNVQSEEELQDFAEVGNICYDERDSINKLYTEEEGWIPFGNEKDIESENKESEPKEYKCPSCGAPIVRSQKICHYCLSTIDW